jgi:hypothetical protein
VSGVSEPGGTCTGLNSFSHWPVIHNEIIGKMDLYAPDSVNTSAIRRVQLYKAGPCGFGTGVDPTRLME